MAMKKGKKTIETPLPEEVIQHIQSFMSGREAARTTILSKSWHVAWLTRPTIDLHDGDFRYSEPDFEHFSNKTIQRYQHLNLKIQSFRLRCRIINPNRIVSAVRMGPTDVELDLPFPFSLPGAVFASETLLRLSLTGSRLDGLYKVGCWSLKSLKLKDVRTTNHLVLENIISSCSSIEELSLSSVEGPVPVNVDRLHRLSRLFLENVNVFLETVDFASRFPCLKDLTLHRCTGFAKVEITSPCLQTISFVPADTSGRAKFHVPNIRKFFYSNWGLPSNLSIEGATREWELEMLIATNTFGKTWWFDNLRRHLAKFRLSKISLGVECRKREGHERIVDVKVVPEAIVVEKLKVNAPPGVRVPFLLRLLGVCRPKLVSLVWIGGDRMVCFDSACKRVAPQRNAFSLKRVNMEVYQAIEDEVCSLNYKGIN